MKINSVTLSSLAVRESQYPAGNLPEFLLVGRSNVGKSSFVNTLINRKNFAHTSSKPGKTQTLNFYNVNESFYLVDVPGYGYASVDKQTQAKFGLMIEEYLMNRDALKRVFLIIDYRNKPMEDDILMYNFLKYYHKEVTIVATKYDKVSKSKRAKIEKVLNSTFDLQDTDNIIYFSSVTKEGKDDYVDFLLDEMGNHRMTTDNRNTKYGIWYNSKYGMMSKNDAFCAAGVSYTLEHTATTGILNPYINVGAGASDAKSKASQGIGTWHDANDATYQPKRGDIFYKGGDHTGIVLDSDDKYIYTIEANTSSDEGVSGSVNTRIRERSGSAPYITSGGFYSPPVEFSNANDSSIKLDNDYINKKLGIQNGGNE